MFLDSKTLQVRILFLIKCIGVWFLSLPGSSGGFCCAGIAETTTMKIDYKAMRFGSLIFFVRFTFAT